MWIAEEPGGDELGLRWDRLVLSTHSFPAYYWDKFVKKKVRKSQPTVFYHYSKQSYEMIIFISIICQALLTSTCNRVC